MLTLAEKRIAEALMDAMVEGEYMSFPTLYFATNRSHMTDTSILTRVIEKLSELDLIERTVVKSTIQYRSKFSL